VAAAVFCGAMISHSASPLGGGCGSSQIAAGKGPIVGQEIIKQNRQKPGPWKRSRGMAEMEMSIALTGSGADIQRKKEGKDDVKENRYTQNFASGAAG